MSSATICPDGAECDSIEVWKYVDPIESRTRWSWTCHGRGETANHATLALALSAITGAHYGRSATPGPTRPDPSLTERQLWGDGSTDA